ncbi:uracil DNA N-glycosylase Thp1 [Thecaphora frezii]
MKSEHSHHDHAKGHLHTKLHLNHDRDEHHEDTKAQATLPSHFAARYSYATLSSSATLATSIPSNSSSALPRRSPRQAALAAARLLHQPQPPSASPPTSLPTQPPPSPSPSPSPLPSSPSPSPTKRKRKRRTLDDPSLPGGGRYASYHGVPDHISLRNDILFCGINPGLRSSTLQHHFAHPTNHFYPSLFLSGITTHRLSPSQDSSFPTLQPLSLGLTNLAGRPTAESSELHPRELAAGVAPLLRKVQRYRPRVVAFVGKGIADAVTRTLNGVAKEEDGERRDEVTLEVPEGLLVVQRTARSSTAAMETKRPPTPRDSKRRVAVSPSTMTSTAPPPPSPPKTLKKNHRRPTQKHDGKNDAGYGLLPFLFVHSGPVPDSDDGGTILHSPKKEEKYQPKQRATIPTAVSALESSSASCGSSSLSSDSSWKKIAEDETCSPSKGHAEGETTLFFVSPSTSARVTTHFLDDKASILSHLPRLLSFLDGACGGAKLDERGSLKNYDTYSNYDGVDFNHNDSLTHLNHDTDLNDDSSGLKHEDPITAPPSLPHHPHPSPHPHCLPTHPIPTKTVRLRVVDASTIRGLER